MLTYLVNRCIAEEYLSYVPPDQAEPRPRLSQPTHLARLVSGIPRLDQTAFDAQPFDVFEGLLEKHLASRDYRGFDHLPNVQDVFVAAIRAVPSAAAAADIEANLGKHVEIGYNESAGRARSLHERLLPAWRPEWGDLAHFCYAVGELFGDLCGERMSNPTGLLCLFLVRRDLLKNTVYACDQWMHKACEFDEATKLPQVRIYATPALFLQQDKGMMLWMGTLNPQCKLLHFATAIRSALRAVRTQPALDAPSLTLSAGLLDSTARPWTCRILTYNLQHYRGDKTGPWRANEHARDLHRQNLSEAVGQFAKAHNLHLICTQEDSQQLEVGLLGTLSSVIGACGTSGEALRSYSADAPGRSTHFDFWGALPRRCAVVTLLRGLTVANIFLPGGRFDEKELAKVLHAGPDANPSARVVLDARVQYIHELLEEASPDVICGDWNAGWDPAADARVLRGTSYARDLGLDSPEYFDKWIQWRYSPIEFLLSRGYRIGHAGKATTSRADLSVDFFMVKQGIQIVSVQVPQTLPRDLSDHFPVLAMLNIPGRWPTNSLSLRFFREGGRTWGPQFLAL